MQRLQRSGARGGRLVVAVIVLVRHIDEFLLLVLLLLVGVHLKHRLHSYAEPANSVQFSELNKTVRGSSQFSLSRF